MEVRGAAYCPQQCKGRAASKIAPTNNLLWARGSGLAALP